MVAAVQRQSKLRIWGNCENRRRFDQFAVALAVSLTLACARLGGQYVVPSVAQTVTEEISGEAQRTVVFIEFNHINEQNGAISPAIGSGFIVDKSGLVITAHHVVEAWLRQAGTKEDPAAERMRNPLLAHIGSIHNPSIKLEFLEGNATTDVALLRLKTRRQYSFSKVCLISDISPGASILAFGFPFGTELTPFQGLLSNNDAPEGRWSANINSIKERAEDQFLTSEDRG
jgi:S1-C subfamily serine protease